MSVHEQFAEDLALYALDCLDGPEKTALEQHLSTCAACRRELEQLRGDGALLALAASGPRPPARAKTRLLNAVANEPRVQKAGSRPRWIWPLGWAAAAALMIAVVALWTQNSKLKSDVQRAASADAEKSAQLDRVRRIVDTLTAQDAMRVNVLPVGTKAAPPEGKAIYSRDRNGLIFMASNLQALPAEKAYELWLIPVQGAPIPAGVFKPDARGSAVVVNPPLPAGVEAKAFAITIEPEAGSAAPTSPVVMVGAGG